MRPFTTKHLQERGLDLKECDLGPFRLPVLPKTTWASELKTTSLCPRLESIVVDINEYLTTLPSNIERTSPKKYELYLSVTQIDPSPNLAPRCSGCKPRAAESTFSSVPWSDSVELWTREMEAASASRTPKTWPWAL